jgi:hypothetical protein
VKFLFIVLLILSLPFKDGRVAAIVFMWAGGGILMKIKTVV